MGPRQEYLRPALFTAHIINVGTNPVAIAKILARNGLVTPDNGLALAEIDNHIAIFNAFHCAIDNLANAVLEFFKLLIALGFTDFLNDNLFGRLCRDTAKIHPVSYTHLT